MAAEYPNSSTAESITRQDAIWRAPSRSIRVPMNSVATIEIREASEVPVLYWPMVMCRSETICVWNSDEQLTNVV